jgi:hypothetical protein
MRFYETLANGGLENWARKSLRISKTSNRYRMPRGFREPSPNWKPRGRGGDGWDRRCFFTVPVESEGPSVFDIYKHYNIYKYIDIIYRIQNCSKNNIYIYTGSKIIKPMNILHEIQKNHQKLHETPWNSITIMSESDNEFPIFQFQHHFRCLAELEEELPEILFRCAEHVSHWISNKSRSELWWNSSNPIGILSESHQSVIIMNWMGYHGIIMGYDTLMKFWTSCHNHGYQHKLYQKIPIWDFSKDFSNHEISMR